MTSQITLRDDTSPYAPTGGFTPAVPFSTTSDYEVTLNREHTLHVVDLAGNPVLGTRTAVRVQR